MKREGRQHGMVRTYPILSAPLNPRPHRRTLNELTSPPTAGIFTKVARKPTNQSKFTGKCGRPMCRQCHIHPACKSRDKAKGANKTSDFAASDGKLKLLGFSSAKGILGYLDGEGYRDHQSDSFYDDDDDENDENEGNFGVENINEIEILSSTVTVEIDNGGVNGVVDDVDDNDDGMSFCEVGFVWESVDDGDESWCLVGEL